MKHFVPLYIALLLLSCSEKSEDQNAASNDEEKTQILTSAEMTFCHDASFRKCGGKLFDFIDGVYVNVSFDRSFTKDLITIQLSELDAMDYSLIETATVNYDIDHEKNMLHFHIDPMVPQPMVVAVLNQNNDIIASDTINFFGEGD